MTESQLTEQIHRLAEGLDAPPGDAAGDLVRGRARLRRRRTTFAGGALAVAIAGGAAWSVLDPGSRPVADPALPAASGSGADELSRRVDALAQQPGSREWERLSIPKGSFEATLDVLRQHADPSMSRIVAMTADRDWPTVVPTTCPAPWTCSDTSVDGASRARLAEADGIAQLAAEFPEGTLVLTVAADGGFPALAFGGVDPDRIKWDDGRP